MHPCSVQRAHACTRAACSEPIQTLWVLQGLGARSRRDLLRKTWVPTGKGLKQLEDDKSVVIRFVVGYRCGLSTTVFFVYLAGSLLGVLHSIAVVM